jgi:calcineurin-like phosphoesterase family protein
LTDDPKQNTIGQGANLKDLFYKPVKIQDKEDNIFFWSDMHLGQECRSWDEPLYAKRGFSSLEEHDSSLVKRWNEKISQKSTIFNLGDMLFGHDGERRLLNYFQILNFKTMYLLFGNHNAGIKQVFDRLEENELQINSEKKVVFCPSYLEAVVNGTMCVLSHYAIASFNKQGKGAFMIHGHSHGNLYGSEMGKVLYKARVVDVGVERYPSPPSFKEIKEKFKNDPVSFDHHGFSEHSCERSRG